MLGLGAMAALRHFPARAAGLPQGVPSSGHLDFDAYRKDSKIGTHRLTFQTEGDAMTVTIAVDFEVSLGPIPLFRYRLRTTEQWQGGRLVAATSQADNDGKQEHMTAKLQGASLAVQGSKSGHYIAPPGAILGTHWNRQELKGPMINPENGELMHFTVADKGTEQIQAAGKTISATHYALTGFATIDLWYDSQSVWSALRAVAKDGSIIDYRLT
jgi:hypothetical protein